MFKSGTAVALLAASASASAYAMSISPQLRGGGGGGGSSSSLEVLDKINVVLEKEMSILASEKSVSSSSPSLATTMYAARFPSSPASVPVSSAAVDEVNEDTQADDLKSSMDKISSFVWGDAALQSNCAIYSGTALTMMGKRTKTKIADIDALCHSVPYKPKGPKGSVPVCLSKGQKPESCPYNKGHPEWFPAANCINGGISTKPYDADKVLASNHVNEECQTLDKDKFERHMMGLKTETDFFPLPMVEKCKGDDLKAKPCAVLKEWKNNLIKLGGAEFKGKDDKYQGACTLGHVFEGAYPLGSNTTFQFLGIMDQLLFKRYLRDFAKCLPKRCGCDIPDGMSIPEGKVKACKAPQDEADCESLVILINEKRRAANAARDECAKPAIVARGYGDDGYEYDFGLKWIHGEDDLWELDISMCVPAPEAQACRETKAGKYTKEEWVEKCTTTDTLSERDEITFSFDYVSDVPSPSPNESGN